MNPSTSNIGSSGFQNPQGSNSNIWFGSPPLGPSKSAFGSSSSGFTRPPRLNKLRKHAGSRNPRSEQAMGTRTVEPAFAHSPPVSTGHVRGSETDVSGLGDLNSAEIGRKEFVFGVNMSSNVGSTLNNYRTDSSENLPKDIHSVHTNFGGKESLFFTVGDNRGSFVFGTDDRSSSSVESAVTKLPDEIRKLKIDGSGNAESLNHPQGVNFIASEKSRTRYRFGSGGIVTGPFSESVETELPNELNKLNIKDPVESTTSNDNAEGQKRFAFGSSGKVGGDALPGNLDATLNDRIKNLNLTEPLKSHSDRIKPSTGVEKASGQTKMGEPPISNTNVTWAQNFGNQKSHDTTSIPPGFHFRAGSHNRNSSGDQVPEYHHDDIYHLNENGMKVGFDFVNKSSVSGMPHVEFKTPDPKGNSFSVPDWKLEVKGGSARGTLSKKKKGKLGKPPVQLMLGKDFVLNEKKSQEHNESFESYSPMDVSPYPETVADVSDEILHLDDNFASSEPHSMSHSNYATDEDIVAEVEVKCTEMKGADSLHCPIKDPCAEFPSEDSVSGAETESFKSAAEHLDYSNDTATSSEVFVTALDTAEVSSSERINRQNSDDKMQFSFASISEDSDRSSFTFAASSSAQGHSSAPTRQRRKKDRSKVAHDASSSTSNANVPYAPSSVQFFPFSGAASLFSPRQYQKGDGDVSKIRRGGDPCETATQDKDVKQETSTTAARIAAQEACEKWRIRGNNAYANGDLSKAEDYYTQGLSCISQRETSRSCLRALMLCYSNRAAARMALGRMREALMDCKMASKLDPNFMRVQVRAANCHLALGEVESALLHFMKCLQSGSDVCVDRKILLEAAEGLENSQKVSEYMKQSAELLQHKTSTDAERALEVIDEALKISSFSEKLLQMKADALFMLHRYEDVINLGEKMLISCHLGTPGDDVHTCLDAIDCSDQGTSFFKIWQLSLIIKSFFFLGRLEEALDFLRKQEDSLAIVSRNKNHTLETVIPLVGTIRELVNHKSAGNEAFKSGKHSEAVEHYTAAISCTVESRPFVAVCFGNRAASYRAMGNIIDAIADYSLAIALDGHYLKAISRRASLYESIRDYDQASVDLQRLISLLTKQMEENAARSGTTDRMSCMDEIRQTQLRLSALEEEARKETPLNVYLILGVEPSATSSDIKKAYRKAALRHHPDKVGQFLARSENGDDGLWKQIADEVHKDADRLFKMIGEAYAVLSDPIKRSPYDLEEEKRSGHSRGSAVYTTRKHADAQNFSYERSSSRRHWQEAWTSYKNTQTRG